MFKVALALAVAFSGVLANPASACQSSSFILDESFKTPDPGWDAPDQSVSYGPAGASIKADPSSGYYSLNKNFTSDSTDICATMIWPAELNQVKDKSIVTGGIIFWVKDNNNFYKAQVSASGDVFVTRLISNKWSRIATKSSSDVSVARLSPSDKNEIEVQITGPHASVRLNGKPVLEFNGQPPSGSGYVGIYANVSDPVFPILFSNFKIATMP